MIGRTISRYRIEKELGRGGMGVVYQAIDLTLKRPVAIKAISPEALADSSAQKRFLREAMTVAQVDHPYVCKIYEILEDEGRSLIVLEYVQGHPLSAHAGDPAAALPLPRIVDLGIEVAEALREAHGKGIVHRDIKPANIMLLDSGHVKVLDFGLAKPLPEATGETDSVSATTDGTMVGTPTYMAPEQVMGHPADARTDIFSFGVVLYELICGRRPFSGATGAELASAILTTPTDPLHRYRAGVPENLNRIVGRMLEKDPGERYQSVHEVWVELRRVKDELAAQASRGLGKEAETALSRPQPSVEKRSWLFASRSRQWVLGFVTALSVVAVIVFLMWYAASRRPALSFVSRDWILIADFDNQTGDRLFDKSLGTAFTVGMEQSNYANVFPRSRLPGVLQRMKKSASQPIDEATGREICIRERVRGLIVPTIGQVGPQYLISARLVDPQTGGTVRSYSEQVRDQNGILAALSRLGADIRRDLGESLPSISERNRDLSRVTTPSLEALRLYTDAIVLWSQGKYPQSVEMMESALKIDPEFAMAHAMLGISYSSHVLGYDRLRGQQHLEQALKLSDRTTERERRMIEVEYASMLGHLDRSITLYEAYLKTYPDDWAMRYNLGNILREKGRHEEAIRQYREVLRVVPSHASSMINIATAYSSLDNPREALAYYQKAFAVEPSWITSTNLNNEYGFTLVQAGQAAEAREVFKKALSTDIKAFGLRSLAMLDLYEGKYRDARPRLEEAILVNQAGKVRMSESRNHLLMSILLGGQGDAPGHLKQLAEAAACLQGAVPQPWLLARIGIGYARAHALDKAAVILETVRKQSDAGNQQQSSDLHRLEGELEIARGNRNRALQLLSLADQERRDALSLESLARAYDLTGDADKAITSYESLLALTPFGWEPQQAWLTAHYQLARLYHARGNNQEARKLVQKLLALWAHADPDLPLLKAARTLSATLP